MPSASFPRRFPAALITLAFLGRAALAQPDPFVDVTKETGLDFVHFNGMAGRFYYPEVVGSGGALLDFDSDGDLDLFLVQGRMLGPDLDAQDAIFPPRSGDLTDRLYRNDLEILPDGSRRLRWVDVTASSGIQGDGYGMGAAVGDIDNDGDPDLFVSNLEADRLWRNDGGVFVDRSADLGDTGSQWSTSAAFVDIDSDGLLDLMVAHYLEWSYGRHQSCVTERGEDDYCAPTAFAPTVDLLLRNVGGGRFADVTEELGLAGVRGNGLGVKTADFNGDGRMDLYVANDLTGNHLWIQQADGSFRDEALLAGAALNEQGMAESSMGVDAGDFDGDGDEDLFMTHYNRETNTVYLNDGQGFFQDVSESSGLAAPSWIYTSWGTAWIDFDMDSRLDLLVVNGAVTQPAGVDRSRDPFPLGERNQLFRNLGGGRFGDVSDSAGEAFRVAEVSRGALFGDLDNDGDTDVVVTNNSGPARVLLAQTGSQRPWVGLRLVDHGRDALGARVGVTVGATTIWRRVRTDGSYAGSNDPRVLVALGEAGEGVSEVSVVVEWLGGASQVFEAVPVGGYSVLHRRADR